MFEESGSKFVEKRVNLGRIEAAQICRKVTKIGIG
jgi:hypothetical protein